VTVFELAKVMGTSVAMIERHYGKLIGGAHAGIAGRLDALAAQLEEAAATVRALLGHAVLSTATRPAPKPSNGAGSGKSLNASRAPDPSGSMALASPYDAIVPPEPKLWVSTIRKALWPPQRRARLRL
jgi:hypothetical protein